MRWCALWNFPVPRTGANLADPPACSSARSQSQWAYQRRFWIERHKANNSRYEKPCTRENGCPALKLQTLRDNCGERDEIILSCTCAVKSPLSLRHAANRCRLLFFPASWSEWGTGRIRDSFMEQINIFVDSIVCGAICNDKRDRSNSVVTKATFPSGLSMLYYTPAC